MNDFNEKKQKLYELLKISQKQQRIAAIEVQMAQADFWVNHEQAAKISKELASLKVGVNEWEQAQSIEDLEKLQFAALFSGQYDEKSAIVSFHAGAGGTEAQDWASMLKEMITHWAENHEMKIMQLDESRGEEAGIKSSTIKIEGYNAYGWLKSEAGVHRLVRISPFDADKARHTSFALIEVMPELELGEVEIDEKDLKIDFYRAGGHGGQNVNKVETAVRVTHLPTGIQVAMQNERSQHQNKEAAMKILTSKLAIIAKQKHLEKISELKGEHVKVEWGSQIRSYVLHPYQLVKDHRTGYEQSSAQAVLEGKLDGFMEAYLKSNYNHQETSNKQ